VPTQPSNASVWLFAKRYPQLIRVVQKAEVAVLAFYSFPLGYRRQIWSANSLERLNKEVSRRCDMSQSSLWSRAQMWRSG
jgi:transposase-like protein